MSSLRCKEISRMPVRQHRSRRSRSATDEAGSFRPSARGQNSGRAGQRTDRSAGMDVFGEAAASQAETPADWQAIMAGQSTLQMGSRGASVEHLQQRLAAAGSQIRVDGDFGAGTRQALMDFQRRSGVSADGVVGVRTAAALSGRGPASAGRRDRRQRVSGRGSSGDQAGSRSGSGLDIDPATFERSGLRPGVFSKALDAFSIAVAEGQSDSLIVTVIDYELPSSEKRFWVIDLERKQLLFHQHTSHGSGSDRNHDGRMDAASNVNGSGMSNVGLLRTGETYTGKHGKSLRLDGLEEGFNDNARERAVVVHAASYVDDAYVRRNGKAGRSLGCPSLDPDVSGRIIDTIKGGKLIFGYYPDQRWLDRSRYLSGGRD